MRANATLLLALTLLAASLVSFVSLAVTDRHTWKNTLGLILAIFPVPLFTLPDLDAPERTRRAVCTNNLTQIGMACLFYAKDHDGSFPAEPELVVGDHLDDVQAFVCPSRLEQLKETRGGADLRGLPEARSYIYVSGLRKGDPADYCLAFDEEWNHYGLRVNVLRVDGRVEAVLDPLGAQTAGAEGALHAELRAQAEALEAQGRSTKMVRPKWSRYPDAPEGFSTPLTVRPNRLIALVMAGLCAIAVGTELAVAYLRRRRTSASSGEPSAPL